MTDTPLRGDIGANPTSLVSVGTEGLDLIGVGEPEDEILEEPDEDLPMDVRQRATRDEWGGKVLSGRQRE